jgi:hypothetical protein
VEAIRKVVRSPGREVSFLRITPDEKARLAEIVYAFRRAGKRTSENEVNRIALNFLIEDYHDRGSDSLLAKVIDALLA